MCVKLNMRTISGRISMYLHNAYTKVLPLLLMILPPVFTQMSVLTIFSPLWFIPNRFFMSFDLNFIINAVWSLKLIRVLRYTRFVQISLRSYMYMYCNDNDAASLCSTV